MAKYRTRAHDVEANKWVQHGDHPLDGIGEEIGQDAEGAPVLREIGRVVAPYTLPTDEDDDPIEYQCGACGSGMASHGVLQLGPNAGTMVCPNTWIVETKPSVFELMRPRVFNNRYIAS